MTEKLTDPTDPCVVVASPWDDPQEREATVFAGPRSECEEWIAEQEQDYPADRVGYEVVAR